MQVSIEELCEYPIHTLPISHQSNLFRLHFCLNFIRRSYQKPMTITSGYRSFEDHEAIYKRKNKPAPIGSLHLIGAAADIFDPGGELKDWVMEQTHVMNRLDLYFEDFSVTKNWLHCQIYPPKSGKMFFLP